jgi:hypothetical protein
MVFSQFVLSSFMNFDRRGVWAKVHELRTENALVKSIPKDTVIAFGDASLGNHFGHLEHPEQKNQDFTEKKF